jgi:hypothetical protein
MKLFHGKRLVVVLTAAVIGVLLAGGAVMAFTKDNQQGSSSSIQKSPTTPAAEVTSPQGEVKVYEGELTCLPHIDTEGPHDLMCAFGLKNADGTYYALRSEDSGMLALPIGKQVVIEGVFKVEQGTVYQSIGTITVTSAKLKD